MQNYATKPNLDTKKPVGNGVTAPTYTGTGLPSIQKTASMAGGSVTTTASTANLSAKYKYPRVDQSVPEAGKNQYM